MDFISRIFAALFSQAFLLKLLTIAGIFTLLNLADSGIRLHIYVQHSAPYGGMEIILKDKR